MSGITTAFWGMTINNYDETDLALVQNGYPDYMREIIHTLEKGEEGTPHIQAWIKLQRQQRLSFVKKLFPRGHFKPLTSDEYVSNTKAYAQKLDKTAVTAAVHKFNDPLHTIESVIKRVVMRMLYGDEPCPNHLRFHELEKSRLLIQQELVMEDYRYAKIFVSATYRRMWADYGAAMFENIWKKTEAETFESKRAHTHTHTHSDEKLSREGGITDGEDSTDKESSSGTEDDFEEEGEGDTGSDSSEDETDCEGGYYGYCEDSTGSQD